MYKESMIVGDLTALSTYANVLANPIWKSVLAWCGNAAQVPDGQHTLEDNNILATVEHAALHPRSKGTFESHREYIDLHYCIEGKEMIEWALTHNLIPTMDFNTQKDYVLYSLPKQASQLILSPGMFAVFFPEDAHMPKLAYDSSTSVTKAVVKIPFKNI